MKKISETIVFFGSGPVAAEALKLLVPNFNIEAIVTKPAKTSHDSVPVMDVAKAHKLKTYTPSNKVELDELILTKPFRSRLGVLIDYGVIVSQKVIDYFDLGIVNSHFSLLPELRGADPITFSILSGQHTTGVSLMLINAAMDEGELITQATFPLSKKITTPELTEKLINLSNYLINEDLPRYINKQIAPYAQPTNIAPTYSRKLTKEDGLIDWSKTAQQLDREIRAYLNWPSSYTKLANLEVIITKAHVADETGKPGSIQATNHELIIFTSNKALSIDRIKPAGKKDMDVSSFLAGYKSVIS